MKKFSLLALFAMILATVSLVSAQTGPVSVTLNAVKGSGVTGTATVAQAGNGTKIDITFKGFAPNSEHAGHIHSGSCENNGPVVFPLDTAKADASGNATVSSTVATAAFSEVSNGKYYLNYHVAATPPGDGIACGNIVLASAPAGGAATTAAATTAAAAAPATTAAATTAAPAAPAATTAAPAPAAAPAAGQGGVSATDNGLNLVVLGGLAAVLAGSVAAYGALRRKNNR